jgi:uncharacterized membrane protein YoaT (DUF817 family)
VAWPERYDLLLLLCLGFQAFVVWRGVETLDELKVICLFHVLGVSMGRPVYLQKLSSWYLLVIVSLLIVVELKRTKLRRKGLLLKDRIGHA